MAGKIDFGLAVDTSFVSGRSAIVTGGASGIGAAVVTSLAGAGCYVTIVDLNAELGEKLAQDLTSQGHKHVFTADVSKHGQQVWAFQSHLATAPNKSIDIVVACAGLTYTDFGKIAKNPTASLEGPPEPPLDTINVNLLGTYYTTQLAYWFFQAVSAGKDLSSPEADKHLVLVSSLNGYIPLPMMPDYASSKFGVRGIFKTLRDGTRYEFGQNLRINMVAPPLVNTPMVQRTMLLAKKLGITAVEPEKAGRLVLRLCCDPKIQGRAVCPLVEGEGLDLCDDWEGLEGAREIQDVVAKGLLTDNNTDPDLVLRARYPGFTR